MLLFVAGAETVLSDVYVGLGSNLGNSVRNIRTALILMSEFAVDVQPSPLYRTAPVGFRSQPAFHNAVCRLQTKFTPFELMERLLSIEEMTGRRRTFRNAPRLLDLDILLFNRHVLSSPPLVLPHPLMAERPFVLRPLADIAPSLRHPVSGLTVNQMLRNLPEQRDHMERVMWRP